MKHLLLTTIAAVVLVVCGPKVPDISIHDAARYWRIAAIKQHLDLDADLNTKDITGSTPLHIAAEKGHIEIAEFLIMVGSNVNVKSTHESGGNTPLHSAAIFDQKELVELLLARGAHVNAKDKNRETLLDWTSDETIADLLRKHGAKTGEEFKAEERQILT